MLRGISVTEAKIPLRHVLEDCVLVTGMAGLQPRLLLKIFEVYGFKEEQILLFNDASIFLNLSTKKLIVLISGTGSFAMAKNENCTFRAGGLGWVLGDEGSGFYIGKLALKAVFANEDGWAPETSLRQAALRCFNVKEVSKLKEIRSEILKPQVLATLAPLVFDETFVRNDLIAKGILKESFNHLVQWAAF